MTGSSCATAEELKTWLNGCGLDTSTWGKTKEKTKTVADLWAELQSGETTLLVGGDGCVQRRLRVVKVVVRPKEVPSAHLETSVQRFPDGRERVRNELLSEKVPRLRRYPATSAALPPSQPPLSLPAHIPSSLLQDHASPARWWATRIHSRRRVAAPYVSGVLNSEGAGRL